MSVLAQVRQKAAGRSTAMVQKDVLKGHRENFHEIIIVAPKSNLEY